MPATESLSKDSSMRPTETFPEYNLIFRLSHFTQKYRINRFFEHISFLGFKMLSIVIGIEHSINGHKDLSKHGIFSSQRDGIYINIGQIYSLDTTSSFGLIVLSIYLLEIQQIQIISTQSKDFHI